LAKIKVERRQQGCGKDLNMILDFSFWLFLLCAISGVIWLVDSKFFKPARIRQQSLTTTGSSAPVQEPVVVEYARSFFPVLLIVFVLRSFLFEPFRIPSDSMMPGLQAGDFIFVSKYSYGIRLPIINKTIIETGKPQRGDVIVFRLPRNPSINYIKRLIGLPGDHIQVMNDQLTINGAPMPQEPAGTYTGGRYFSEPLVTEDLGTVKHLVMFLPARGMPKDFDGVVPAGHYLFMGDNRDNSQDGRFPEVGFVPDENLVGQAQLIWFNYVPWLNVPKFSRVGTRIH